MFSLCMWMVPVVTPASSHSPVTCTLDLLVILSYIKYISLLDVVDVAVADCGQTFCFRPPAFLCILDQPLLAKRKPSGASHYLLTWCKPTYSLPNSLCIANLHTNVFWQNPEKVAASPLYTLVWVKTIYHTYLSNGRARALILTVFAKL